MIKQADPLNDIVSLSFKLIIIPAIILACITVFYSQNIIEWMYNEHVYYSSRIFPLLMFGFISISVTYIFGTLLTANGNLKELNILAGSALIMNVVLNLILIPRYQAYGAAVSSLITQTFMAITQIFVAVKKFEFHPDWGLIIRLGSFTGAIFIFGWFSREYIPDWYLGSLILAGISVLCAFTIGLLNIKDLYRIVRFGDENRELRTEN
jgi:O-antigen/teichoic acid export membrane protein